MKQIKKFKTSTFFIIIFLIAAILSLTIVKFTPTRNVIKLPLEIDLKNKYTDYFKTKNIFTSYVLPDDFIRDFDNKIRTDDKVYGFKNECKEIKN